MMIYVAALAVSSVMYMNHVLPWYFLLAGLVSVIAFFYYSQNLSNKWAPKRIGQPKRFEKKVFMLAMLLRLFWVVAIYIINQTVYGDAFGFDNADTLYYDDLGKFVARMLRNGEYNFYDQISQYATKDISDMGNGIYTGFIYFLSNDSILFARIIKALLSSITVLLIYRLAVRNFGESTGRLAAIFCVLWPNFWYYCGTSLKESEMVFLGVLFVEQADQLLRSRNFSAWKVFPILLIAATLFGFRTPLALVAILSLLFTIFMSSSRVVGWGKRIIIGVLALGLVGVTMGNRIQEEAQDMWSQVRSGQQRTTLEWRGERTGGNQFAKYAGATVFAPMIFTIPFPTVVDVPDQEHTKLLNGGNFIKNILSVFVIYVMLYLLFSGKWREHMLPLSFMLGYLVVLVMSTFAQSERFHQPAMPMELMFAAYGISLAIQGVPIYKGIGNRAKYRLWYGLWSLVMLAACVTWSWFKLAGRGLA